MVGLFARWSYEEREAILRRQRRLSRRSRFAFGAILDDTTARSPEWPQYARCSPGDLSVATRADLKDVLRWRRGLDGRGVCHDGYAGDEVAQFVPGGEMSQE